MNRDHEGVLYKRRDVFTRQWRPRWFQLQSQNGILHYYLLSGSGANTIEPPSIMVGSTPSLHPSSSPENDGSIHESFQYDVLPRGSIYLRDCHVRVADEWSRPADQIYCFVITAPDAKSAPPCYLATTTEEQRDVWVAKIHHVCTGQSNEEQEVEIQQVPTTSYDVEVPSTLAPTDPEIISGTRNSRWTDAEPDLAAAGLEPAMKSKIEEVIDQYLPLTDNRDEWSILFENKDGVTSYQRASTMIKSVAILDHHPKQVFNIVADAKRRKEYEKNIRYIERLKRCNSHTFIDYYAYHPIWPTMAREFLVVFHWRVVQSGSNEKAIVLVGFSHPDGHTLRPLVDDHVRAELEVSLFLLELMEGQKTKVTRIISYDLRGNIPRSLTNNIMQQQATMPYLISRTLKANEPSPPSTLSEGEISDTVLAIEIVDRLSDDSGGLDGVRRKLHFESCVSSSIDNDEPEPSTQTPLEGEESEEQEEEVPEPLKLLISLILMTPLVLYNLIDGPWREKVFLVSAFVAVRTCILLHLGTPLPEYDYSGTISCNLTVNLRGYLRFLTMRRNEGTKGEGPDPSIVPLVVKAVAIALSESDGLNSRKIHYPFLGMSGYFLRQDASVSVLGSSNSTKDQIITLRDVIKIPLECIASKIENGGDDKILESSSSWTWAIRLVLDSLGLCEQKSLGSCLVVTCPDSDGFEIDLTVTPSSTFNAIVLVGGVRISKQMWPKSKSMATIGSMTPGRSHHHPVKPPKPLLAISISVECPACSVTECRRFAERVQELVEEADL